MTEMTRNQVIDCLRQKLLTFVDDEHSICEVAGKMGFFCKGFSQWDYRELAKRHEWIAKKHPQASREDLEDLANRWQLARQAVLHTLLACDTQCKEHHTCRGWDEFTDQQLAGFYQELFGEAVAVTSDPARLKKPSP